MSSKHTSEQTYSGLIHYVYFFVIGFLVISDIVSGYFDVFKDRGHLGKLGLQIIRDMNIDFQSTKQLLVSMTAVSIWTSVIVTNKRNESTPNMSVRKYVWRKDHGYFTFAEVICRTRLESDPDPSSGGIHACNLFPEIRRTSQ
jgi:hypothetical protein